MHTLSAIQIRDKFLSGEVSAVTIVEHFLRRIERHDPQVGAFLTVFNQRALAKAIELDKKRASGVKLGKLAAVPIAFKDNIHVKGEITTCASKFLTNYRAPFDATVTRLLEAEDAIIIGKTNMDEFAMGSSTENSALNKNTRNPWNLACTPGGSSGGSAAAVAARLVPLALGSDTGGSIRQPAALCGITGFKPTYGRVSRYGVVAFGSSLDQIGPLATNAADAALVMEIIGQGCNFDSTSIRKPPENLVNGLNGDIKGLKIGVPWQFLDGLKEEPRALFEKALANFQALGATLVDVDLSILKYSIAVYYILATAEAATNLARFDGIRYGVRAPEATTLDEIYELSREEGFGPEVKRRILLGTFVLSAGHQDAYYKKAQKVRGLMLQRHKEAFAQCDIIASPTAPTAAFEVGAITDPLQMYLADIYSIGANLVGMPAVSIPCGFTSSHMPFGLQLTGPQGHEKAVFHTADAFERATDYHTAIPDLFHGEAAR